MALISEACGAGLSAISMRYSRISTDAPAAAGVAIDVPLNSSYHWPRSDDPPDSLGLARANVHTRCYDVWFYSAVIGGTLTAVGVHCVWSATVSILVRYGDHVLCRCRGDIPLLPSLPAENRTVIPSYCQYWSHMLMRSSASSAEVVFSESGS